MIYGLDDVRQGFDVDADAVVVGTGAGGAVAAANLARAGLRVVVLEAGPELKPEDMVRNAPIFLARAYWDGGLRTVGGSGEFPCMQGRCLGGSTVVNSAIMLKLPAWVREEWRAETGLDLFTSPALEQAYERVFARSGVAPTPMAVLGRRNLVVRDALAAAGMHGYPLPRSVIGCEGCADCMTGCTTGRKQSTDRTYIRDADADGAQTYTCSVADKILMQGNRAVGIEGNVVDPRGHRTLARFRVRAPRVVLGAGALNTPALLLRSGITGQGQVGATFFAHLSGGVVGIMHERTDPWVGATQGWGAISDEIPAMKFECLWAPLAALAVRWGDVGRPFLEMLPDVKYATLVAVVYRGRVKGRVRVKRDGTPRATLSIPREEAHVVFRGLEIATNGLLDVGARYVYGGHHGTKAEMRTKEDAAALRSPHLRPHDMNMTANHVFGSTRMGREGSSAVDENGAVHGVLGLTVCDASIFPSPSAVNPQATIMALSDIISRRLGELAV